MKKSRLNKRSNLTKLKKEADRLFSIFIRNRDKICRKCKKAKASQCAHIFSRSNLSVRYDEMNALGFCFYCHLIWSHREPVEFTQWVESELGAEFKKLEKRARKLGKVDYNQIIKTYEER